MAMGWLEFLEDGMERFLQLCRMSYMGPVGVFWVDGILYSGTAYFVVQLHP